MDYKMLMASGEVIATAHEGTCLLVRNQSIEWIVLPDNTVISPNEDKETGDPIFPDALNHGTLITARKYRTHPVRMLEWMASSGIMPDAITDNNDEILFIFKRTDLNLPWDLKGLATLTSYKIK